MRFISAVAFWLAVAGVCLAGDVVFTNADFQNKPQQVRSAFVYYLDGPTLTGSNNITRDRVDFKTDLGGYFIITNYYPGNYRIELQGTKTTTTNWFEFPATNGTINGTDPLWSRGPTNGITQVLTVAAGNSIFMPLTASEVIQVFSNGTVLAPWGWVDTSASTTKGLKEALDAQRIGSDLSPGGTPIKVAAGIYFVTNTLVSTSGVNRGFTLVSDAPNTAFLVYAGTKVQPLLRVDGPYGGMKTIVNMRNMVFCSITNMQTNLVELKNIDRASSISGNWFGGWLAAMQDNSGTNISATTNIAGLTPGINTPQHYTNTAIVGIRFDGPFTDEVNIEDNAFTYCACGIDLYSVDHAHVSKNFFNWIGLNSSWATTSPYSIGACIRLPGITNLDLGLGAHNFWQQAVVLDGNHYVNSLAGRMADGDGGYYDNTVAYNESFETVSFSTLLDGNHRFADVNLVGSIAPGNLLNPIARVVYQLIQKYPVYQLMRPAEPERARSFSIVSNYNTLTYSGDLNIGSSNFMVRETLTNFSSFNYNSSTNLTWNATYTNVASPYGAGTAVWTNGGNHLHIVFDPTGNTLSSYSLGLASGHSDAPTLLKQWATYADVPTIPTAPDPLIFGAGLTPDFTDATDNGILIATYVTPFVEVSTSGQFTGNGSGITNIPIASIASPGLIVTNGESQAITVSNAWRIDKTHTLTASNVTALTVAGFDAANQLTNITVGSGLSLSAGLVLSASGSGSDATAWHNTGDSFGSAKFIGTTDNFPFRIKANNAYTAEFRTDGSILFGLLNSDIINVGGTIATAGSILSPFGANTNWNSNQGSILAGNHNQIFSSSGTIAGGSANIIFPSIAGDGNFIGAGNNNITQTNGGFNVLVGGQNNTINTNGAGDTDAIQVFLGGGSGNNISAALASIAGGSFNSISARYGAIPGGANNVVSGQYGFAAGRRAKAVNQGAFVLADSQNADQSSSTTDEYTARFQNGFRIIGPTTYQTKNLTKTSNFSLTSIDSATYVNNSGAGGTVTNTLPAATAGLHYSFVILTAQNMTVQAVGSDTLRNAATASAAGGFANASTIGNSFHLYCPVAGQWLMESVQGTWTLH